MWLAGCSLALPLIEWSAAAAQDAPAHISATMREGRVTLAARDASLRAVLAEFGRASGIEIHLEPSVAAEESTTIAFDRMAPEDGLRRLLRAKNFILVYSGSALAEVRAYPEGRNADAPPAPPARSPRLPARSARPPVGTEADSTSEEAARREAVRLRAQALGHPDPDERAAGLAELAAGDDEHLALRTAANVLETERVPDVLERALSVFAGVETAPIEPLLAFLDANRVRETSVRVQALELVTERGQNDPRVRALLIALARSDTDSEVRQSAQSLLDDLPKN
jgi:hypothetical protein